MPDDALNCAEARGQMQAYLSGEPCPLLDAHLAGCDDCRLACMESALREAPAATIPPRFAAQVVAMLPAEGAERSWAPMAGVILFALLGVWLWWRGDGPAVAQMLLRWEVLVAVGALEAGVVLAWAWRVVRRAE